MKPRESQAVFDMVQRVVSVNRTGETFDKIFAEFTQQVSDEPPVAPPPSFTDSLRRDELQRIINALNRDNEQIRGVNTSLAKTVEEQRRASYVRQNQHSLLRDAVQKTLNTWDKSISLGDVAIAMADLRKCLKP
jgi:hypothetical protein